MKFKFYAHFFIGVLIMFSISMQAQVIINEFSASNYSDLFDNFGDTEDWVELYNAGATAVDLEGYFLSDNIDNVPKWTFPAGISIDPGEHLLIYCSDRDLVVGGNIHAGFKLTQTKQEWVVLADPSQTVLDAVQLTNPTQTNHSRGRVEDADPSWGLFLNPSPGGPNGNALQEYVEKPVMNITPGFYSSAVTVSITVPLGSSVYYTTDGSEPTQSSTLYDSPITVTETSVLKAIAFSDDAMVPPSFTEFNTYFINDDHTIPVLSIAGSNLEDLLNGQQFDPIGSLEYFDYDGSFIDEAYGDYNKHGNDSWAYPQRGIDYITRDQMGYTSSIAHEIFETRDRDRFQRFMIKAAANDNYPFQNGGAHIRDSYVHHLSQLADMELDERSWAPCIMYVNGEYWGVYDIREKVDDPDYTRKYYDQGRKWIDFIKTWGGTWEEYGSRDDWDDLHNYITNNSMADPDNYATAAEDLNMLSLVDYMILNTHVVCKDWLNWNTAWWRGRNPEGGAQKWRYALWDMDATFGHYINYTNIPNDSPQADPCDNEVLGFNSDPEGHVDLIISLLESEEFHSLYVNRYADFNNSYLSCDSMITILDRMLDVIEPEMPRQIERWGGTMAEWQSNVQELKDFILGRCVFIDNGIGDCYDVEGPFPVTVKIVPEESPNGVKVNTFIPNVYPFEGDYFSGTTLSFEAAPDPAWELDHWEVDTNSFNPDQFAQKIDLELLSNGEVITAYFRPIIPCAGANNIQFEPTLSTLEITWEGFSNSISFEVNWRKTGSTDDWEVISTVEENYTIFGLEVCTEYDVRVRSICENAIGDYEEFVVETECINNTTDYEAGIFELNIYPNPFQKEATVDFILAESNNVQLNVYSIDGKLVGHQNFGKLTSGQHKLNVQNAENWNSGIYLMQIVTETGVVSQKVIKS